MVQPVVGKSIYELPCPHEVDHSHQSAYNAQNNATKYGSRQHGQQLAHRRKGGPSSGVAIFFVPTFHTSFRLPTLVLRRGFRAVTCRRLLGEIPPFYHLSNFGQRPYVNVSDPAFVVRPILIENRFSYFRAPA